MCETCDCPFESVSGVLLGIDCDSKGNIFLSTSCSIKFIPVITQACMVTAITARLLVHSHSSHTRLSHGINDDDVGNEAMAGQDSRPCCIQGLTRLRFE